jgi:hypothetical protein
MNMPRRRTQLHRPQSSVLSVKVQWIYVSDYGVSIANIYLLGNEGLSRISISVPAK